MISLASRVIQVSLQWSSAMVSSKNNSNLLEQSHLHKMARRIAEQWQWCNQCSAIRVFSVMILCTSTMSWRHTPETNLKHMFYDVFPKKYVILPNQPKSFPKIGLAMSIPIESHGLSSTQRPMSIPAPWLVLAIPPGAMWMVNLQYLPPNTPRIRV